MYEHHEHYFQIIIILLLLLYLLCRKYHLPLKLHLCNRKQLASETDAALLRYTDYRNATCIVNH